MKWWSDLWLNEGFATFAASVGVDAVEPAWGADRNYAVDNIIYLVKYSYQNAEQDDLWAELTAVSDKYGALTRNVTVKRVMDAWTTQTGYPLIDVEREYGSNSLTLTQKRYLALGAKAPTSSSWWVPLRVLCEGEAPSQEAPLQWLADDEGLESRHQFVHGASPDQWRNWRLLANALTNGKLDTVPVLGRVQLLSDAFELAWTNRLNYTIALQSPDYGAFQKYVRRLVGDAYVKAGGLSSKTVLNGDDINSVKMQVPGCEENAIELFQKWMDQDKPDENNPIPIDLRRTVYCVAVSRGSVREWRFALARRQRSNVAAARDILLVALTCTREWSITDGSEVRRQDAASVIVGVLRSTVGFYVAKDFFLIWLEKNEKYLTEAKLAVSQAVEKARVNIDWITRNRRGLVDQLRERAAADDVTCRVDDVTCRVDDVKCRVDDVTCRAVDVMYR
ncbi:Aminopeptidase N-like protein [Operophtera brumata]|uniref:Aminopeptidase N-like protein n=1 Tax=Operophtera brumata TaxID=104452 RepID=A0A0L7L620_OPEBR|nr:Aminopeptidase N-like protein [Operophtera brumata]